MKKMIKKCLYKIRKTITEKKQFLLYILFGIATTFVNILIYFILVAYFDIEYKTATSLAWLISVFFAFITNRLYVFNSSNGTVFKVTLEFISFVFFRLISYTFDLSIMILLVEYFVINDVVAKCFANVTVIVFNYFVSKYIIFKKKKFRPSTKDKY